MVACCVFTRPDTKHLLLSNATPEYHSEGSLLFAPWQPFSSQAASILSQNAMVAFVSVWAIKRDYHYLHYLDERLQLVDMKLEVESISQPHTYDFHGTAVPLLKERGKKVH